MSFWIEPLAQSPRHAEGATVRATSVTAGQPIALALFDRFRLHVDDGTVQLPGVAQRLIAFVALVGPTHRNVVCGRLWPESSEKKAHASLRTALWIIQQSAVGCLNVDRDTIELHQRVQVDVAAFRTAAWEVLDGREVPPSLRTSWLALLAEGELLPGWYDEWLDDVREQLRQLRLHALEALADRCLASQDRRFALDAAMAAASIEPLRESSASAVIAVHLEENNVVEAVRYYERFRLRLWRELRVEPSAALTRILPARAVPTAAQQQNGSPRFVQPHLREMHAV